MYINLNEVQLLWHFLYSVANGYLLYHHLLNVVEQNRIINRTLSRLWTEVLVYAKNQIKLANSVRKTCTNMFSNNSDGWRLAMQACFVLKIQHIPQFGHLVTWFLLDAASRKNPLKCQKYTFLLISEILKTYLISAPPKLTNDTNNTC